MWVVMDGSLTFVCWPGGILLLLSSCSYGGRKQMLQASFAMQSMRCWSVQQLVPTLTIDGRSQLAMIGPRFTASGIEVAKKKITR